MSTRVRQAFQSAAGAAGGGGLDVDEVFSTYLYTGNGSSQTITNGIDLSGEGGMVWVKNRDASATAAIVDTERGASYFISPSETAAQAYNTTANINALNSDGFTVGTGNYTRVNGSGYNYASWTFRKAPKFFDVVTYTGDGTSNHVIPHGLNCDVGTIIIKVTSEANYWMVFHRSVDNFKSYSFLNGTDPFYGNGADTRIASATSTSITLGNGSDETNATGKTYVAYLFAHNDGDGGFGPDGDQDIIKCGSYTGNGLNAGQEIDLGFEPQFVLYKCTNNQVDWRMVDNMRGVPTGSNHQYLRPNLSSPEYDDNDIEFYANGFRPKTSGLQINSGGASYIYMAIRRGSLFPPESATEVYSAFQRSGGSGVKNTTGWPIDAQWVDMYSLGSVDFWIDRLRGISTTSSPSGNYLNPQMTATETSISCTQAWDSTGYVIPSYISGAGNHMEDCFRRAPGFFDVVAYTGDGVAGRTVPHNLGVAPELMIVKNRTSNGGWLTYAEPRGISKYLFLNASSAETDVSVGYDFFFSTSPTATDFTVNSGFGVNGSGQNFIAYLFATLPGVSKVGSYTGNGSSQTIDCGFTSGARFILIKRTDSTGNWCKYNYALGINAGTEQFIRLDQDYFSTADYSAADEVDPNASGFVVNQLSTNNLNVSGGSYIFYAIA